MVTEKMIEALKPCPFCGCEDILDGYIRDGREIVCGECRASIAAFHPDASKRAAERWNRRAEAALSTDAEPVAFTSQGQIDAARNGSTALFYGKRDEFMDIALYAAPPAPSVDALPDVGKWTDDDRARAWREAFDTMHQRAMKAEAALSAAPAAKLEENP